MAISTGWFGIPGDRGRLSTKVHAVLEGKPLCGATLGKKMQFQWCANGIEYEYLECRSCKKIANKMARDDLERRLKCLT